jgi:hypothetical protein
MCKKNIKKVLTIKLKGGKVLLVLKKRANNKNKTAI